MSAPTEQDWKKLSRVIRYLRGTRDLSLTLEAVDGFAVKWWMDASFAVHNDMKSQTGITMSLGKGSVLLASIKQKINTRRSSTKAELVGVNDAMTLIIWTQNFLKEQGQHVTDNMVYQDNQSAILLENNGKASSRRRTHHLDNWYFFITDWVGNKEVRIEYCPMSEMLADFFTKPLQGSLFYWMHAQIMNIPTSIPLQLTMQSQKIPQECVGNTSWAGIMKKSMVCVVTDESQRGINLMTIQKCSMYSQGIIRSKKSPNALNNACGIRIRSSHNFYQI